ncbi:MAG TPA: hypothetical protein DEH02_15930 [Bacteroidales bacterium]|nr:MAG: hypothetical protein A2X01_05670 [Bacteroidetes bacterium GWF2_35_48]HBX52553.1 hypothetical protein [Bacteroidales bacterium]
MYRILFSFLLLSFFFLIVIPSSAQDEFKEWNGDKTEEKSNDNDEFKPLEQDSISSSDDEFKEFNEKEGGCSKTCSSPCGFNADDAESEKKFQEARMNAFWWVIGILGFVIITGFLVRWAKTRKLRLFILLASLIVLGFYKGACPCPISSVIEVFFAGFGLEFDWTKMVWFLGLLPITYIFGKVWCGWVCHLGALQEFLYRPGLFKIFTSARAQIIMRYIRIVLFITLAVQIFMTQSNLWCKIDPFKTAFNLFTTSTTSLVLLGLLLFFSVFMYRPFCKAACPIGLVLGWISKLPGASVMGIKGECKSCKFCDEACNINAITRDGKHSILDNQECIVCGDCMNACRQKGLGFFRKSKTHKDIINCNNECSL